MQCIYGDTALDEELGATVRYRLNKRLYQNHLVNTMQQIQSVFSILLDGSWKGLMTQLASPRFNFWKLVQIQVFAFTCLFPTILGLWSVDSLEVSLSAEAWESP